MAGEIGTRQDLWGGGWSGSAPAFGGCWASAAVLLCQAALFSIQMWHPGLGWSGESLVWLEYAWCILQTDQNAQDREREVGRHATDSCSVRMTAHAFSLASRWSAFFSDGVQASSSQPAQQSRKQPDSRLRYMTSMISIGHVDRHLAAKLRGAFGILQILLIIFANGPMFSGCQLLQCKRTSFVMNCQHNEQFVAVLLGLAWPVFDVFGLPCVFVNLATIRLNALACYSAECFAG